ncbi:MAG: non-ribosomal peptide synthetase [Gammaproteobacteria bacterium]
MNADLIAKTAAYQTLNDALYANRESECGVGYLRSAGTETRVAYRELLLRAGGQLHRLQSRGLRRGDQLILFLNDNERFIEIFWACQLGAIVPVPVAPGVSDEHRHKLFRIFAQLERPYLYTDEDMLNRLAAFAASNGLTEDLARVRANTLLSAPLENISTPGRVIDPDPDDIAFIQYSSGSTSEPKGVVLTHRNLMINIKAIIEGARFSQRDVSLSWMPLTHDMGLIGFHLNMLACDIDQYLMPTELFIRRPLLWLTAASDKRANILCSPNFGYKHFLRVFDSKGLEAVDLSHVRLIFNGAEPISVELCDEFLDKMSAFGLPRAAMFPVYGLAEASLAVSFPPCGEEYRPAYVHRDSLHTGREIEPLERESPGAVGFVPVGRPIRDCAVRIADDAGRALKERTVGRILIKGDNVAGGYYKNPDANRAAFFPDGWLDTGDLGFVRAGELVITGRSKDIVFVNGQNYYPHDLENIAQRVKGLELGKVAVAGHRADNATTDELLVFVLFRGAPEDFVHVAAEVARQINEHAGVEVTHVIPVARIPKTTSGKVQRHALARDYAQGAFNETLVALAKLRKPARAGDQHAHSAIEHKLKQICDAALGDKAIGIHESLFEVGTSSLVLVEIHEGIEAAYPGQVDITDLFDYPTIAELAAYLRTRLDQAVN